MSRSKEVESILVGLNLEEKVSLLAGSTMWRSSQVPGKVGGFKVSDGANGIRGESMHNATKTACFPCAVSLAATFDPGRARQVGRQLNLEAKAKGVDGVLAPTVNLHRSTLGGRTFEAYSEDPVLSGLMAIGMVNGIQEDGGVFAVPKHLVCNEAETNRKLSDSIVDERTLRELYLAPFQMLLRGATVKAMMAAYNKLNGTYCSENTWLVQQVLRKEWGFQGLLMSDWHGTYSTVQAAKVGVDLEMPGETLFRGSKLVQAVQDGTVEEVEIDERAARVIQLSPGSTSDPEKVEETRRDQTTSRLIRDTGAEAIVLLKNDYAVLPLRPGLKVAVVGTPAAEPIIKGGGSSTVSEEEVITPLAALRAEFPDLLFHPGVPVCKKLPSPQPNLLGSDRVQLQWFNGPEPEAALLLKREVIEGLTVHVFDKPLPELQPDHCIRMRCTLTPKSSGCHTFGITSSGLTRLYVDDEEVLAFLGFDHLNPDFILQPGNYEQRASIPMESGRRYSVRVDARSTVAQAPPGWRICPQAVQVGFAEEMPEMPPAVGDADVALVFVGNTQDYESESFDRDVMGLSPGQDDLVRRVSSMIGEAKTVVVNMSGSPVEMPWVDYVGACLQMWYAGQQAGNSIADVLTGRINPCGRLPSSFPRQLEDVASHGNFPSSDGGYGVRYEEGIYTGYRHHNRHDRPDALFPFGHGLSYSTFQYAGLRIEPEPGDELCCKVCVTVTNTGPYDGKEVVQLYVGDLVASVDRPAREFKQCAKLMLCAGETAEVALGLDATAFSFWSMERSMWVVERGAFSIEVCASSNKVILQERYEVQGDHEWTGLGPPRDERQGADQHS